MEWVCAVNEDGCMFLSAVSYTFFRYMHGAPFVPMHPSMR